MTEHHIHVHFHSDPEILATVRAMQTKEESFMSDMDDRITALTTTVAAVRAGVDSNTVTIKGINAALAAALAAAANQGATPAQLQQLTDLNTALAGDITDLAAAGAAPGTQSAAQGIAALPAA